MANILGELSAGADARMLREAFFETRAYRELLGGTDFRFVVGRRGAGKSALFQKLGAQLQEKDGTILISEEPNPEKMTAYQSELLRVSTTYSEARHITKLTWRLQVLTQGLSRILKNYKAARLDEFSFLETYRAKHAVLFEHEGIARGLEAFRQIRTAYPSATAAEIPEKLADHFGISRLRNDVVAGLRALRKTLIFLFDGLDEGWLPTSVATSVLGGLSKTAAEFREASQEIHCVLFVRDNMLRALAQLDGDYTRDIEGNALRLQWDETSLLEMLASRLRVAFGWKGEQAMKAWNRFADRGLQGIEGFRVCLNLTLFRPRDLIALLNGAWNEALRSERTKIIDTDIERTATAISKNRLLDLYKEYERVLPGLPEFAESFRSRATRVSYDDVRVLLEDLVGRPHAGAIARDFALLNSASDAFNALFSVGFIGVQDEGSSAVRFCHDGSDTDIQELAASRTVVVHPCYWRALDLRTQPEEVEVLVRVDDEHDAARTPGSKKVMQDLRMRKLGQTVEEFNQIPEGLAGARLFEAWVLSTVKYLASGKGLDNIQPHPNPDCVQQRDIVGTNRGEAGFWRRLERDYAVNQLIIECKNFAEMDGDVFRQAGSYLVPPYGRCLVVVTRASSEAITKKERTWVAELYIPATPESSCCFFQRTFCIAHFEKCGVRKKTGTITS